MQHFGNAELLHDRFDCRVDLLCRTLLNGQCQRNIFVGCQRIQQVEILKDKAELLSAETVQRLALERGNVRIFEKNMSCCHAVNGRDAVEQRSFSAAGCTHDRNKLALFHIERDIVNRFCQAGFAAVVFFDLLNPK